jgi:hypothetical protein
LKVCPVPVLVPLLRSVVPDLVQAYCIFSSSSSGGSGSGGPSSVSSRGPVFGISSSGCPVLAALEFNSILVPSGPVPFSSSRIPEPASVPD